MINTNICNYDLFKDIIIPIVSAVFGGVITMIGVILTIRSENKKGHNEYIERIRPFLTIETQSSIKSLDLSKIKKVMIYDDCNKNTDNSSIAYHLVDLLLTNISDYVCFIDYLKINEETYKVFEHIPIKANETVYIEGFPQSFYLKKELKSVSVGVSDRLSNCYEYELSFEEQDDENHFKEDVICKKLIFSSICCRPIEKKCFGKKRK